MSKDEVEKFIKAIDKEDTDAVIKIIRSSGIMEPDNGMRRFIFLKENLDDKNDNHEALNSRLNIIRPLLHEGSKTFMSKVFRQVMENFEEDIALFLLEEVPNKLDVNAYDVHGQTALHTACKKRAIQTVEFLLKHGVDIDAKSTRPTKGSACLHDKDDEESRDCNNVFGKTALHFAVKFCTKCPNYYVIETLLQYGADANATDDAGSTCLHFIYTKGSQFDRSSVSLLEVGADPNVKNNFGKTPLHRAAKSTNVKFIEVLLQYGADVNVACNNSLTPLDYAASENIHGEVVALIINHIIAMKALDLHVSENNLKYIDLAGKDRNIFETCKQELAVMKNKQICKSEVTFYDLLTASLTQLAVYGQDGNLFNDLRNIFYNIVDRFFRIRGIHDPYYNNMIAARINELRDLVKKQELIRSSLERLKIALVGLFGKALPKDVASQVIECYSEKELKNSSKAPASYN